MLVVAAMPSDFFFSSFDAVLFILKIVFSEHTLIFLYACLNTIKTFNIVKIILCMHMHCIYLQKFICMEMILILVMAERPVRADSFFVTPACTMSMDILH